MRKIRFGTLAWEQYIYWQGQDRKTLKKVNALTEAAAPDPADGLGKPEPLKGQLSGYWSRRIDEVNRLVYRFTEDELVIIACRFHYDDT
jgi:toxin YoeB